MAAVGEAAPPERWLTPDLWSIGLSAFFSDMGYQVILGGFALFMVGSLHSPVWAYGLAMAVLYGPGALWTYVGGRVGDRWGHRRVALWGNALVPLMSLAGLAATPVAAVAPLAVGWWARNFRKPSRQAMLRQAVAPGRRGRAFGFLHTLDQAGAVLAGLGLLWLLAAGFSFAVIFLLTAVPLGLSTVMLSRVRTAPSAPAPAGPAPGPGPAPSRAYRRVLVAAALYGFGSYSLGFPVLTVAQGTHSDALGIGAFVLYLAVSSATGTVYGRRTGGRLTELAGWGYGMAGLGSAGLAAAWALRWGVAGLYPAMGVLGFALGVVGTLEPTVVARLVPARLAGRGFGGLSGARGLGLFSANVAMGVLYHVTPVSAYAYAAAIALAAMVLLTTSSRRAPQAFATAKTDPAAP